MNVYYVKSLCNAQDFVVDAEKVERVGDKIRFLNEKGEVFHEESAERICVMYLKDPRKLKLVKLEF